jgi:hypothetical protein
MAAWTEPQKTSIRHYVGAGIVSGYGFYPPLEDSMSRVLAIADGGQQVSNSTQLAIVALLADIATVETQLKSLWTAAIAVAVDEIKIDSARAMAMLRMEGRRLSHGLAKYLGFRAVLADVWSAAAPRIPPVIGSDFYS